MSRNTFSTILRPSSRGRAFTAATTIKSLAVVIVAVSTLVPLRAQSCNATLTNLQTWVTTAPAGWLRSIAFNLVSNRSDGTSATYSESSLGSFATLSYASRSLFYPFPFLTGTATQYINNNRFNTNGTPYYLTGAPFNPLPNWFGTGFQNAPATQTIYVTIDLPPAAYPDGLVLLTPGTGPTVSFIPSCQNGILYGFVTDSKGTTIYAMNLIESQVPLLP
jgi:hypothetical protein